MHRFRLYELRTTDIEAARAFYRDLLGADFWGDGIDAGPLPSQAAARGAPPHWLGHIGVDDLAGTTHGFLQSGAALLGPSPQDAHAAGATLRDPCGAVVALTPAGAVRRADRVAWHLLCARDETEAFGVYSELLGWVPIEAYDLGPQRGRHVTFAWDRAGEAVGSAANLARLPHVHPQWLFCFRTERLDDSLARVRALGGLTLPPEDTPTGDLVAACDDPQGAAFALYEARRR